MKWLNGLWRRLRHLRERETWEADLAEEMRLHLELRAEENSGLEGKEALAAARRRFGNVSRVSEDSRAAWGWTFLESLAQDVRYGFRTLLATPGFALAALLSLALGIGANTAIFCIVNALMLRALPVEDPHRLVEVQFGSGSTFTNPLWEQLRDNQRAFSGVFAFSQDDFDLARGGERKAVQVLWASGNFFQTLGVPALRGRVFNASDDIKGGGHSGPVAVISYGFWKTHFAGSSDVLGKTVFLDRHPFQVVGVTPPWFHGLNLDQRFDAAIPIGCEPLVHTDRSALENRSWWWLRVVGRLNAGESIAEAQSRLQAIAPQITRATLPDNWHADEKKEYLARKMQLLPATQGFSDTRTQYRTALFVVLALVNMLLLIACANVANLLLARAEARQREMSIRLAIGAGRRRLIRQLLTESFLLAAGAALIGFFISLLGSKVLIQLLSTSSNELELDVSPDWRVFAFNAAIAILTLLLFGLAPAFRAAQANPNDSLKENARGTVADGSRLTLSKGLVMAQIALSLVLVVGAGLFLQSFRRLLGVNPGFSSHGILLMQTSVPANRVPVQARSQMFDAILQRASRLPGVSAASSSWRTPITHMFWNEAAYPEGFRVTPHGDDTLLNFNRISPGYFRTLETPLLAGRDFSQRDTAAAPRVIIISESAARRFWPGINPLGKIISLEHEGSATARDAYRVIGVVADSKYGELSEPTQMTAYLPVLQNDQPEPEMSFEVRSHLNGDALLPALRKAVSEVNGEVTVAFHSLDTQVNDSLLQPRVVALLSSCFGGLALLLAAIGLYGVMSYTVARRRSEIGIRMALGAEARSVIWLVLRDVLMMVVAGGLGGLLVSLAAGRLVSSLLFGITTNDPTTLIGSTAVLALASIMAGYLPARRASRLDPTTALRDQ